MELTQCSGGDTLSIPVRLGQICILVLIPSLPDCGQIACLQRRIILWRHANDVLCSVCIKIAAIVVHGWVARRRGHGIQVCHFVQERLSADGEVLELVAWLTPRVIATARIGLVWVRIRALDCAGMGKVERTDQNLSRGTVLFGLSVSDGKAVCGATCVAVQGQPWSS